MKKRKYAIKEIAPVLVIACGITYAAYIHAGYEKGRQEYRKLEEQYASDSDPRQEVGQGEGIGMESTGPFSTEAFSNQMNNRLWRPLTASLPENAPAKKKVEWEALLKDSPCVAGWITVPAVGISYPVMQADDNDYYLHRDVYGNSLFAGAIFLDASCSKTMYNYNTIIYGHNMRDGSMFAHLADFRDMDIYRSCPYFWIQTPEADILYEIFSIHYAGSNSDTFAIHFPTFEELKAWQEKMAGLSDPPTGITLQENDRVVTLSTCTDDSSERMTVQGRIVWRRDL